MTKVMVELERDTIEKIIKSELHKDLKYMQEDLENRKNDVGVSVFDTSKKKDIALMKQHIAALEIVLKYYGVDADA